MFRLLSLSLILALGASLRADVSPRTGRSFFPERARLVKELQLPQGFGTLSQSVLSGNAEVCAMESGRDIHFYSTRTGEELSVAKAPVAVHDGAFSYNGSRYATAENDGKVHVWNTATGEQVQEFDAGGGFC